MVVNISFTLRESNRIIMQGLYIQRKANVRRIDIDHGGNHARNRHIRKKSSSRIRSG